MKKLLAILFILVSIRLSATTYYVNAGGGGDYTTIAQVNAASFSPGDIILFNRGDVWRETLEVPSSGTSGSYITFGAYGAGANPQILGSALTTAWTDQGGNIWRSNTVYSTNPHTLSPGAGDVVFLHTDSDDDRFGAYKSNTGLLVAEYDWTWSSNYIYVYSVANPGSAYTGVEGAQRRFCISTNDHEYLHFDGIDLFYCSDRGIDTNMDHGDHIDITGCIFENSEVGWIGGVTTEQYGYGIALVYSDLIIRNCEVHHCGRRGIALNIYGSGFTATNILVEDNYLHNGYHTTGIDINVGAGGYTGSWDGMIIRRNKIEDPLGWSSIASNLIFIQNSNRSYADIENLYIYSNIFMYPIFSAINMEGTQSVYVYNNTFFEVNSKESNSGYQLWIDSNNEDVTVKNNIFYCTSSVRTNGHGSAIYCASATANCDIDYNLYYRISNSLDVVIAGGTTYYLNTLGSLPSNWEDNGLVTGDPTFADEPDDLSPDVGSIALGAGVNVSLSLDYLGNVWSNPPAIGAIDIPPVEPTLVTDITVTGAGDATTIEVDDGTLQMSAAILPVDATNQTVTWSRINGTGEGLISATGLVTAVSDGTMTARATANDGSGVYGDLELTFSNQTGVTIPTVSASLTSWTSVNAIIAGNVTDDGGGTVSARGICYSTSEDPDTGDNIVPSASGTGAYSCTLWLASNTTYYIRAYATNEEGTAYSNQLTLTTKTASAVIYGGKVIKVGTKAIIVN